MKYLLIVSLLALATACAPQLQATPGPDTPVTSPPGSQMPTSQPSTQPFLPQPGDENMTRSVVYLDEASLLIRESFPPQVSISLRGNLPTPCNQLRAAVNTPDRENRLMVEVYSVADPDRVCAEVLEPFEEAIDLGSFPTGHYTVWVNGNQIGEFDT